jgi:hypothetical protein
MPLFQEPCNYNAVCQNSPKTFCNHINIFHTWTFIATLRPTKRTTFTVKIHVLPLTTTSERCLLTATRTMHCQATDAAACLSNFWNTKMYDKRYIKLIFLLSFLCFYSFLFKTFFFLALFQYSTWTNSFWISFRGWEVVYVIKIYNRNNFRRGVYLMEWKENDCAQN